MSNEATDALIAVNLRGDRSAWPGEPSEAATAAFLARVDFHGVAALLLEHLRGTEPATLRQGLRDRTIAQWAWELRHSRVLGRLLASLEKRGVRPILIKGTALAYEIYDDPAQRARGDTDILVAREDRETACAALGALGFRRSGGISGDLVSHQASYVLGGSNGQEHLIDLHWQIDDSALLGRLFSHRELLGRAVHLSRLSTHALGAGLVDALLIACMHRQKHLQMPYHVDGVAWYSADRLIWLYDIHLLANAFSPDDWEALGHRAHDKGLAAVAGAGLSSSRHALGTRIPAAVLERLACAGSVELPATYLKGGRLRREWMDFCAQGERGRKLRYLRETVFPPADYMRSRFPDARMAWLPWLYARRAFGGIASRLGGNR